MVETFTNSVAWVGKSTWKLKRSCATTLINNASAETSCTASPSYYGAKPDFGDVDIILSRKALGNEKWELVLREITTDLGIQEFSSINKNVYSTVYRDFQVDFFLTQHESMEPKRSFMDLNDIGNIIGRLFRVFNLKYSERVSTTFIAARTRHTAGKSLSVETGRKFWPLSVWIIPNGSMTFMRLTKCMIGSLKAPTSAPVPTLIPHQKSYGPEPNNEPPFAIYRVSGRTKH